MFKFCLLLNIFCFTVSSQNSSSTLRTVEHEPRHTPPSLFLKLSLSCMCKQPFRVQICSSIILHGEA